MRARLVRGSSLAEIASGIGLGKQLKMGEGELKSGGSGRASILTGAFEAVLGALFLDGGFNDCRQVILDLFDQFRQLFLWVLTCGHILDVLQVPTELAFLLDQVNVDAVVGKPECCRGPTRATTDDKNC